MPDVHDPGTVAATAPETTVVVPPRLLRRIKLLSGRMSAEAVAKIADELPYVADLTATQRADVQMLVQDSIRNFLDWVQSTPEEPAELLDLGRLPPELGKTLNFRQTVDMIRAVMTFFERWIPQVTPDEIQQSEITREVLRYSREIGFTAAAGYAAAAERRGAWDTRLEAMVVDAVVRGQSDIDLESRAAALNWDADAPATVLVGSPSNELDAGAAQEVHAVGEAHGRSVLAVAQGNRLLCIVGGGTEGWKAFLADLLHAFSPGPVVLGPRVSTLALAHRSARAALAALGAVSGWAGAPRPVAAHELLPERVLAGDDSAREMLIESVFTPIHEAGASLLETLEWYIDSGGHVEACARALYVHPNTVRYRLKRVLQFTDLDPLDPRDRLTLKIAVILGKLEISGKSSTQ